MPGAKPAFIQFVQTFGDLVNFHPHVHVLAADGVFRADGTFVPLPPIPEALLEGGFRRAVLAYLVEERAISEELRCRMLGWRYSGFSVHNRVRVAADDAEGRKKLAGYMLRAPLSLAKMRYDAASGTVMRACGRSSRESCGTSRTGSSAGASIRRELRPSKPSYVLNPVNKFMKGASRP